MQLMQRFGSTYDDTYLDDFFSIIKKHPGSCDNVWFATPYGFPKIEKHKEAAERLKKAAVRFREAGVTVSLQLSNSIGHGEYMSSCDCTGLIYDGAETEHMVGPDGTVAGYCFCPNGTHFREYLLQEIAIYAELRPDCLWVDDDFRATNHAPVQFGCFCDGCVAKYNRRHGTSYTRETLVEDILHGDLSVRESFITGLRQDQYELMYAIGKTLHEISPETRLGMQYGPHGAFAGHGSQNILDAMRDSTGHDPYTRPGGGSYDDTNPNDFLYKAWLLDYQNALLPDYAKVKCPEIENLPFVAYGKTPAGTAFETAHYFASGNTDMSYSMMMHTEEPLDFYEKTLAYFAGDRPYWERLSALNGRTIPSGLRIVIAGKAWKKPVGDVKDLNRAFGILGNEPYFGAYALNYTGIPMMLDKKNDAVNLLHPEVTALLDDDEVTALLGKNVITDGESIAMLQARGYDFGLKTVAFNDSTILKLEEKLTDHAVNPPTFKKWSSSFFTPGKHESTALFPLKEDIEVLGIYDTTVPLPALDPDGKYPFGVSEVILTTPQGGHWAVFGYAPWKGVISHNKRDQFLNAADYISGNALAARVVTDEKVFLKPRIDNEGKTAAVSVTNVTVGELDGITLLVRRPASHNFTFVTRAATVENLPYTETADGCLVTLPPVAPWSVCTVFVEE